MTDLFQLGDFRLHSGGLASWKIDCDALTDGDLNTLARIVARELPDFSTVEGVPRGGVRFGQFLRAHVKPSGKLLIVDDVLTTGASLEEQRRGREAIGVVIFARGQTPGWVNAIFRTDAATCRDPRNRYCECPLPYRAIVPETHEESCPIVRDIKYD